MREGAVLGDGATGSLLFELTGRLSEANHVYEALSIHNPDLVQQVHIEHLRAGARALKTNTFNANDVALARAGLDGHTVRINRASVSLARRAIEQYREEAGVEYPVWVLGSAGPESGPPGSGMPTSNLVEKIYGTQLRTLIEAGVDAVLFETFESIENAVAALALARAIPGCPPVILHFALRQDPSDGSWNADPREYVVAAAAAGADVVGVNCCAPWEALEFVKAVSDLEIVRSGGVLISAMPNAGGFERIGHRYMSKVNPEYMGRLAKTLSDLGASLVGGCCEVHPAHIREMHGFLRASQAGAPAGNATHGHADRRAAGADEKRDNGPFSRKIFDGEFVVSVELLPPRGTRRAVLSSKIEFIRELAASGLADAVDVTDGSRGVPLMPPGDFIQLARADLEWGREDQPLELIPHFTARDLNLMGVQSRLMGYHAAGVHNVLFVTGDPPKMSPAYPRSTPVFDLDSVGMIEMTHSRLNAGVDFGGQPLDRRDQTGAHFTIGTGFEPEALDADSEYARLERKLEAGADYVMTQPVFDTGSLRRLDVFRNRVRILIGVMVLTSAAHAERFASVPGVHVPPEVVAEFERFESREDQLKAGVSLALSQVEWVRSEGWGGLYLMSPATHAPVLEILAAASRAG